MTDLFDWLILFDRLLVVCLVGRLVDWLIVAEGYTTSYRINRISHDLQQVLTWLPVVGIGLYPTIKCVGMHGACVGRHACMQACM